MRSGGGAGTAIMVNGLRSPSGHIRQCSAIPQGFRVITSGVPACGRLGGAACGRRVAADLLKSTEYEQGS
jgi:hypothetical protein